MPPLELGDEDYIDMLFEAGPALHGYDGWTPLTWQELAAWRQETGAHLTWPEKRLIKQLSGVYASAASGAAEHDATSAFLEQDFDLQVEQVQAAEQGMAMIFRTMTAKG